MLMKPMPVPSSVRDLAREVRLADARRAQQQHGRDLQRVAAVVAQGQLALHVVEHLVEVGHLVIEMLHGRQTAGLDLEALGALLEQCARRWRAGSRVRGRAACPAAVRHHPPGRPAACARWAGCRALETGSREPGRVSTLIGMGSFTGDGPRDNELDSKGSLQAPPHSNKDCHKCRPKQRAGNPPNRGHRTGAGVRRVCSNPHATRRPPACSLSGGNVPEPSHSHGGPRRGRNLQ